MNIFKELYLMLQSKFSPTNHTLPSTLPNTHPKRLLFYSLINQKLVRFFKQLLLVYFFPQFPHNSISYTLYPPPTIIILTTSFPSPHPTLPFTTHPTKPPSHHHTTKPSHHPPSPHHHHSLYPPHRT